MIVFFPRRKRRKSLTHIKFQVDVTIDDNENVTVYLSRDDLKIKGIKVKVEKGGSIADVVQDYILNYVKLYRRYKRKDG